MAQTLVLHVRSAYLWQNNLLPYFPALIRYVHWTHVRPTFSASDLISKCGPYCLCNNFQCNSPHGKMHKLDAGGDFMCMLLIWALHQKQGKRMCNLLAHPLFSPVSSLAIHRWKPLWFISSLFSTNSHILQYFNHTSCYVG